MKNEKDVEKEAGRKNLPTRKLLQIARFRENEPPFVEIVKPEMPSPVCFNMCTILHVSLFVDRIDTQTPSIFEYEKGEEKVSG